MKHIYGDFPTLAEIKRDYSELMEIIKNIRTIEQAEDIQQEKDIIVEINGMPIDKFKSEGTNEDIEWIRYEAYGCLSYIYDFFDGKPSFDVWCNLGNVDFIQNIKMDILTEENYNDLVEMELKRCAEHGILPKEANKRKNEVYIRLISADICDFLEELLDKHNLTIPSEDREGIEGEARIYGEVYSDLESNVTDVLATLCGTVKENPDILINENEIDELNLISSKKELHVRAFAVKICELFEELLDEHDITIPNDDREGEEDEARIFGDVYYDLEDDITGVLAELCEKVKAVPDIVINVEDYNGFIDEDVSKLNGVNELIIDATQRSEETTGASKETEKVLD